MKEAWALSQRLTVKALMSAARVGKRRSTTCMEIAGCGRFFSRRRKRNCCPGNPFVNRNPGRDHSVPRHNQRRRNGRIAGARSGSLQHGLAAADALIARSHRAMVRPEPSTAGRQARFIAARNCRDKRPNPQHESQTKCQQPPHLTEYRTNRHIKRIPPRIQPP
jgi:hypothetical protein